MVNERWEQLRVQEKYTWFKAEQAEVTAYVEELRAQVAQLKQWVSDTQSGMYINCVYCGHRYGPEDTTPTSKADMLTKHIEECPEHPMSKLKKRFDELVASSKMALEMNKAMLNSNHMLGAGPHIAFLCAVTDELEASLK